MFACVAAGRTTDVEGAHGASTAVSFKVEVDNSLFFQVYKEDSCSISVYV